MFFKRKKVEVVKASELTDYSERFKEFEKMRKEDKKYATRKTVAIAATAPATVSVGLAAYNYFKSDTLPTTSFYEASNVIEPFKTLSAQPLIEPSALTETYTPLVVNTIPTNIIPEPTGVIADASLTALATVLDPIIELLVAISFPIASVIVVCAFFLIMIGNKEKAFDMMMHAGLGYILIQLSPMFLEILKTVGEAM
ncbi:hypothetical protein SAMN05880501_10777 [Ureibacillus xyleni]|uniref:Uncharacterized protein n=1 Tax=Ureibacillus xyleni TaxID=614648 RepID=A0A285SX56_9BACL|nr:hypothetical protein [Ureibacillus xyleni]SOC12937.1 hypothetical protein SAMN05880501_10777 [Ureibacillus xyleni]